MTNAGIGRARQDRGRFRTFLLTAFRNFLFNEWQAARAVKRGEGVALLSLDFDDGAEAFGREPVDGGASPEQAFDRNWATGLVDDALASLRHEYEKSGRGELFRTLRPLLWHTRTDESLGDCARHTGIGEHALTMALHRLRNRFGIRLRQKVAETVPDAAEVEDELRYLISLFDADP